jgi:hypothetical protein
MTLGAVGGRHVHNDQVRAEGRIVDAHVRSQEQRAVNFDVHAFAAQDVRCERAPETTGETPIKP